MTDYLQFPGSSAVGNGFPDGFGKQERLLQHNTDVAAQPVQRNVPHIHPANGNAAAAFRKLVQPVQQIHQGGFSAAGRPQNSESGSGRNGQVDSLQDFLGFVVTERNIPEDNVPIHGRGLGIGGVFFRLCSQNFQQTAHGNPGLAQLAENSSKVTDGPHQHGIIGHKCQKLAVGQIARSGLKTAGHHNDHDLKTGKEITDAPVQPQQMAQPYPHIGELVVFLFKPVDFKPFPAKRTHHPHASEILLRNGGQFTLCFIGFLKPMANPIEKQCRVQNHHRHKGQGNERKGDVHGKHDNQRCNNQKNGANQFQQLVNEEIPDDIYITGTALDDVAGLVGAVPLIGELLDMSEKTVPQTEQNPFTPLGDAHAGKIVEQSRQKRKEKSERRTEQQVLPQCVASAQRFHPG